MGQSISRSTGEIHRIQAHAFGDNRLQPLIEWIDTPGRGDTRGESYDSKLRGDAGWDVLGGCDVGPVLITTLWGMKIERIWSVLGRSIFPVPSLK